MIACIIIVTMSFIWLGYETQWFTPRLTSSKPLQSKSSGIKTKSNATGLTELKPIDKTIPYYWQSVKDNMMLCQGCRLHCHKDKERWTGWKIPTRTIKAWGSTIHFEEGCNIKRATMLKDIARLQKRHSAPRLEFGAPVGTKCFDIPQPQTYYAGQFEPTIDILVDGELKASINGDYKNGMIADVIKPYTKTVRAGKKTLTLLKGGYVENMGGGAYIAINGEVKNGEYEYFKS